MAGFSGIEPLAAASQPRDQRGASGALAFGAAVTHREAAHETRRVSPAAIAHRKRAATRLRADDDAEGGKGRLLDINV